MINQLPDPGLGEKFYQNKSRMVNKDGTFNAKRTGLKLHLYHYLISISAFKFSLTPACHSASKILNTMESLRVPSYLYE